ncbi:Plasmodium exported protein, unknown function [Plasmodium ovale wallikeri]|uniref:Tryptophan/threonine-rich plasmodium antigen C-terminal domain-containing protein n=1 Tax=Plasmodium ovale wallikeri TaxID=864142 RepID=A0A1A9ASM2_PLAOA|nr:Plasmodium exported protein, unknown function [Plasmodium ovale wallikeri]
MKATFLFSSISCALFILSSVNAQCYRSSNTCGKGTPPLCKRRDENGHITHQYLQQKLIDVYEKEHKKKKEWENWFDKQKKIITEDLEYKKNQWLQESEHSWEEYIVKLEEKWMHPGLGFETEYKCKLYPQCGKWPGKKWLLWFKKKGLDYLKKDYQKWLKSRLTDYNKLMKKTLLQHNTKYQEEWCTLPGSDISLAQRPTDFTLLLSSYMKV